MTLKILKPYCFKNLKHKYQGIHIISFISKPFQFRLFTDCGEWFLYIHIVDRWWRFSGAGYLRGRWANND